jgi:hypothetical protein
MKTWSKLWSNQQVMIMLHLHYDVILHICCTCINIYRVLKNGLQALRGSSKSPSQHTISRNQCLLRYGWIFRNLHVRKSGRSWNQCAKNCSCSRDRYSPCLENSPWAITLPIPHPASASPHSFWPLWMGGVLPVASLKMRCKHTVYSYHPVYWWGGIHKGLYCL